MTADLYDGPGGPGAQEVMLASSLSRQCRIRAEAADDSGVGVRAWIVSGLDRFRLGWRRVTGSALVKDFGSN